LALGAYCEPSWTYIDYYDDGAIQNNENEINYNPGGAIMMPLVIHNNNTADTIHFCVKQGVGLGMAIMITYYLKWITESCGLGQCH